MPYYQYDKNGRLIRDNLTEEEYSDRLAKDVSAQVLIILPFKALWFLLRHPLLLLLLSGVALCIWLMMPEIKRAHLAPNSETRRLVANPKPAGTSDAVEKATYKHNRKVVNDSISLQSSAEASASQPSAIENRSEPSSGTMLLQGDDQIKVTDAIEKATLKALAKGDAVRWRASGETGYIVVSSPQTLQTAVCRNVYSTMIHDQKQTQSDSHLWCEPLDGGEWNPQ